MILDPSPTSVFIRDDDAGVLTPELRRVAEMMVREGVPVNYQIIPEQLTEECARYLVALHTDHPGLVELNQHGLRHEQTINGRREFSEFTAGRPLNEQRSDIRLGQEMLRNMLGDAFDETIFTPPCHRYERATLRALADCGISVVSAGVYHDVRSRAVYSIGRRLHLVSVRGRPISYHLLPTPQPGVSELSTSVNVDMDRRGRAWDPTPTDLTGVFADARRHTSVVGLLLHHHRYTVQARAEILRRFLDNIRAAPGVRFVTMSRAVASADGARGRSESPA